MRVSRYIFPLLLATTALAALPTASFAQVAACGPSVTTADAVVTAPVPPPALPVYEQPPIPAPGYLWTPGYWSYATAGYYWVPGTWVLPPTAGLLWTPAYWGWHNGLYAFNAGYWGLTVGFYGGINYGFGYNGAGYWGGRWDHGQFAYNRTVNNFGGVHITNVYNRTVIANNDPGRASYNGGVGGVAVRPPAEQEAYAHERHLAPTQEQTAHVEAARNDPSLRATENHGRPQIAATARPGELHGTGVVAAREAAPANGAAERAPSEAGVRSNEPSHTAATEARPAEAHPNAADRAPTARTATATQREEHATTSPEAHVATRPAEARPAEHAAARPAEARPAEHAASRPTAPRPAEHTVAHPAAPHPAEHAAARPAAPRPAARPAAARPEQHAAARTAAPRPQMHAAAPHPAEPRRG